MTQEKMGPLRERMIPLMHASMYCRAVEDMRIRGMGGKATKAHIRAIKHFT